MGPLSAVVVGPAMFRCWDGQPLRLTDTLLSSPALYHSIHGTSDNNAKCVDIFSLALTTRVEKTNERYRPERPLTEPITHSIGIKTVLDCAVHFSTTNRQVYELRLSRNLKMR
jgi:hypothetical protein